MHRPNLIENMEPQEFKGLRLYNCDNLELMATLPDSSIDVICIDPPYLYLKGQKLERAFDEQRFFAECKRLLTKDGFIVMFGRGTSFYRWNTILADLGFEFKEEIVWNKQHCTSPLMSLSRVHETISIATKTKGTINKVKVPYVEMKSHNLDSIITDIKRLKVTFNNTKSLDAVLSYLENNEHTNEQVRKHKTSVSVQPSHLLNTDRCAAVMQNMQDGMNEKSIIRTDFYQSEKFAKSGVTTDIRSAGDGDRCVKVINAVAQGMNEKSIIQEQRNHYKAIHPTEKPVRLIERLLALVIPKGKPRSEVVVADFFAGSMSTMEAVLNMGMQGIATEIDKEYFDGGKKRIQKFIESQGLFTHQSA